MSTVGLVGVGAATLLALIDWSAVARGDAILERRAKPAVILALIAGVVLSDPAASTRSLLLATALGASLLGDYLLLPPGRFTQGLLAFLFAHVAYLALFLLGPLHLELAAVGAVAGIAVLLAVGRGILAGAGRAGMRRPVALYLAVIVAMAIAATASGSMLAAVGAWLFITSDAVLGWDRFAAPTPAGVAAALARRLVVIVTYHAAQILLVIAILGHPAS